MCNCVPDRRGLCDECIAKSRTAEVTREEEKCKVVLKYVKTCPDSPEREAALLALGDDEAYKRDIARKNAETERKYEDALLHEAAQILQRRGTNTLPKMEDLPKPKPSAQMHATHIRVKTNTNQPLVGLILPIHATRSCGVWEVDVTEIAAALRKRKKKGDAAYANVMDSMNRYQAAQTVCVVFRSPHAEPV